MPTKPETRLYRQVVQQLKALKAEGVPIWWFKLHGGPMQRAGVPDLMIVLNGLAVFVELKMPGNKPTKLQVHTMAEIAKANGLVVVATSVEQMVATLRDLLAVPEESEET